MIKPTVQLVINPSSGLYALPLVTDLPYLDYVLGRALTSRWRIWCNHPPAAGSCGGSGRQHVPCHRLCKIPERSCLTSNVHRKEHIAGDAHRVFLLVPVCPLVWGTVGMFLLAHGSSASGIPKFNRRHVLKGSQESYRTAT